MSRTPIRIRIASEPDVTRSVLEAKRFAQAAGFEDQVAQLIATAVSELASNIVKYAGTGEIVLEQLQNAQRSGVEITAQDRGPGIADIEQALTDHFSSGGSLGLGLPGVKRMMDELQIESPPGKGTRVVARRWHARVGPSPRTLDIGNARAKPRAGLSDRSPSGVFKRPEMRPADKATVRADDAKTAGGGVDSSSFARCCVGERVSGDVAVVERDTDFVFAAIVDVLGHGPEANVVARRAEQFLRKGWSRDLVGTIGKLHAELKGTRGAAAGLCILRISSGELWYAGVGNTVLRRFGQESTRLCSSEGILGERSRTPPEQRLMLKDRDVVVLYTDGVKDRFELKDWLPLLTHGAQSIAKNVVERFGKPYDDATCVVLRYQK